MHRELRDHGSSAGNDRNGTTGRPDSLDSGQLGTPEASPAQTRRRLSGRRPTAVIALLLTLVGVAGFGWPAQATADGSRVRPSDIYKALGVDRVPAAYVVLVDTSTSMKDAAPGGGTLYGEVKKRLRTFLGDLPADDQVAVVAFGQEVSTVHRMGRVTSAKDIVDDGLPSEPNQQATDFGSALEEAAAQLESTKARTGSVLLLSDGVLKAPGTPYNSFKTKAWDRLRGRYDALSDRMSLTGYGVPLAARTDLSGALGKVFATPRILPHSPDQLGAQLNDAKNRTRTRKAVGVLEADVGKGVVAEWAAPGGTSERRLRDVVGDASGKHTVKASLTLRSTATYIPLRVSKMRLVSVGDGDTRVRVTGLPRSVDLSPGQKRTYRLRLSWSQDTPWGLTSGEQPWRVEQKVAGSVESPWEKTIHGSLGYGDFDTGDLSKTSIELSGTLDQTVPGWLYPSLLLLVAAFAGGTFGAYAWRYPRLSGELKVIDLKSGRHELIPLRGRRLRREARAGDISAVVAVRARRGADRHADRLELSCARSTPPSSGTGNCGLGKRTILCGIAFAHSKGPRQETGPWNLRRKHQG